MAKVGAEFVYRSPGTDLTIEKIGEDQRRRASAIADMCLEIVEAAHRDTLPAWGLSMTKDQHAAFAQDIIEILSIALDCYQNRFPSQGVCLDERKRDRGWFDLKTLYGIKSVCVFCRRVIYVDEAKPIRATGGRGGIASANLGELDRKPPERMTDRHLRIAEYHGLACACLLVAGMLEPKSGSALDLAVI